MKKINTHEEDCPCPECEQAGADEIEIQGIASNEEGEE